MRAFSFLSGSLHLCPLPSFNPFPSSPPAPLSSYSACVSCEQETFDGRVPRGRRGGESERAIERASSHSGFPPTSQLTLFVSAGLCLRACAHMFVHARLHTHTCMNTHEHTHTHTHEYKRTQIHGAQNRHTRAKNTHTGHVAICSRRAREWNSERAFSRIQKCGRQQATSPRPPGRAPHALADAGAR